MIESENTFQTVNEKGENVTCDVLLTFDSDETKKSYIVYTDRTLDKKGQVNVYASVYNPDQETTKLLPVETDREWELIEQAINLAKEEIEKIIGKYRKTK